MARRPIRDHSFIICPQVDQIVVGGGFSSLHAVSPRYEVNVKSGDDRPLYLAIFRKTSSAFFVWPFAINHVGDSSINLSVGNLSFIRLNKKNMHIKRVCFPRVEYLNAIYCVY